MSFIVAVDGPAGSGKGSVTKKISKKMHLQSIDTGAMYRCVTLEILNKKIKLDDIEKINRLLENIKIELKNKKVYLNDEDVTKQIREEKVNAVVSDVSKIKIIREKMNELQRKIAEDKNVIVEGRDIATVVFPKADVKIYLDATPEERARRRLIQNKVMGIESSYDEVLENIKSRDKKDSTREIAPLKIADDTIVIDTTNMTKEAVVKKIETIIKSKQKKDKLTNQIYQGRKETKWKKFSEKFWKSFAKTIYYTLFRVRKINENNIPAEEGCIICANHINAIDAGAIVLCGKRKVYFIGKEEMFHSYFGRKVGHLFNVIPIKRGKQDIDAIKKSLQVLKDGNVLGIFPEGTRNGMRKNIKVKTGAVYLALKAGVKIVPVGIQGNLKMFRKTYINYGKPIDFSEYQDQIQNKTVLEKLTQEVMENIIMLTKGSK